MTPAVLARPDYIDANATIAVTDLARALRFYADVLGLKLRLLVGTTWAELRAPGLAIGLVAGAACKRPDRVQRETVSGFALSLQVSDLEPAMQALAAKGVTFLGVLSDEVSTSAAFTDPDGNPLRLWQRRQK